MAARRAGPARSRTNTNTMNARDAVAARANIPDNQAYPECNIQVVIRCRRRSPREISENSPIIVSSAGAKSSEITIQTSTPTSSLGVVTLPPTRTYPFDLVFGPEADQAIIYHDVVSPMLAEVLQGYNCTLFAYGQTGTGKTCARSILILTYLTLAQIHNAR
jgi:kinesin family member 11